MAKVYILGHKNPDCDSACAPKVYEWYLKQKGIDAEAILQGKLNNESKWVFEKFEVETPKEIKDLPAESKVIVVDTTEPKQLPDNIEEMEVIEVWDHHQLGGLRTSKPLKVVIDTVGCTCTLLFERLHQEQVKIDKPISGIMISSILSDTLNLTSPTTTDRDRKAVDELTKVLGIDREKHVKEQFEAKSSLEGMSTSEIVNFDAKEFEMSGRKVKIGVFETVDTSKVLEKKDEIKKFMLKEKKDKGYDYSFYFAIDVLKGFAVPIVITEEEKKILEAAYNQEIKEATKLERVVSRKKQMIPQIAEVLAKK